MPGESQLQDDSASEERLAMSLTGHFDWRRSQRWGRRLILTIVMDRDTSHVYASQTGPRSYGAYMYHDLPHSCLHSSEVVPIS